MTNAEQFKKTFGIYAEEFWSYTGKQMLVWINTDVPDTNVGDMISRQAAIDAIEAYFGDLPIVVHHDMLQLIKKLPSAERRGRWINGNEGIWNAVILPKCSICGETFYEMNVNINGEYTYNYCPNCGARMEVE